MDSLGMTAAELARRSGIGASLVGYYLSGKAKRPSLEKLQPLASALQTTPEALLGVDTESLETLSADQPCPAAEGRIRSALEAVERAVQVIEQMSSGKTFSEVKPLIVHEIRTALQLTMASKIERCLAELDMTLPEEKILQIASALSEEQRRTLAPPSDELVKSLLKTMA